MVVVVVVMGAHILDSIAVLSTCREHFCGKAPILVTTMLKVVEISVQLPWESDPHK